MPASDRVPAVDPEEFESALHFVNSVHRGNVRLHMAVTPPVDSWPWFAAVLALNRYCGEDRHRATAILIRGDALARLTVGRRLGQWQRNVDDHDEIHPVVLRAAAIFPLNGRRQFPVGRFLEFVGKLAENRMKSRDVERLLLAEGWVELKGRGKGSHRVYSHPNRPGRVILSWHNDDLKPGTLDNILKQAGLK